MQRTASLILVALGISVAALGVSACAGDESAAEAKVTMRTPPVPAGVARSDLFTVRARPPGGSWRDVGVYAAKVDLERPATVAMAVVESDRPVEFAVTRRGRDMDDVRIRPEGAGVHAVLSDDGHTAYFTVERPVNLSIEPDGETHANLQLFVNPVQRRSSRDAGRRVIRYGPGLHKVPGDHTLRLRSHTTVELAAGAVLHGRILIRDAEDVVVRGSGVIDGSPYFGNKGGPIGVFVDRSSEVGIKDVTILRGQNGGVTIVDGRNVVLDNVKEINSDEWSDGIDVHSSENVLVDGGFFRTSDDSIAIWASSPWIGRGDTRNVTVRDVVLWPDLVHAVLIGPFGAPGEDEIISDVDFQGVDVLEQLEDKPLYQGAIALNAGDDLTLRDIRFERVRIDRISQGQAFNVRVFHNPDYDTEVGRSVRNVMFRDVAIGPGEESPSVVSGWSPTQTVSNVLFENVRRDDVIARDAAGAELDVGPYAEDVVVSVGRPFEMWDDDDSRLRWSDGWRRARFRGALEDGVHGSTTRGATMTVRFTGRQARILGATMPTGGRFGVFVDGEYVRMVDTYAGDPGADKILFDTGPLPEGRHTMRLRVNRTRNALSEGHRVAVDSVQIIR